MIILLHSSKSMKPEPSKIRLSEPDLLNKAKDLAKYIQSLTESQLQKSMKLSSSLAKKTHELWAEWSDDPSKQTPAMDIFRGDIYSGLQAHIMTKEEREYANQHLRILSGLYGILKPLDGISPYRLEMAYKLPNEPFTNLYKYWGDAIAKTLPPTEPIINLAADEYTKAVLPHLVDRTIISPKFLTVSSKTGEPTFVVVHAKIARGAFANWLITNRIEKISALTAFNEIGYQYDPKESTKEIPVFTCQKFGGKGLSVKLR